MLGIAIIIAVISVVLLLAPLPFPNKDAVGWCGVLAALVIGLIAVLDVGVH